MTPLDIESLREHHLTALERHLLDEIEELTRQLSDARDKAINAGIFTSSSGDESKYTHALNTDTCEGCGRNLWNGLCHKCETETSTPGATSYKP